MISKQEEKREADYLKTVLYVLEKQMDKLEAGKEQLDSDIREAMKYIWEVGSTEADDWNNSSDSVRALNRGVVTREHSLKAYRRMLDRHILPAWTFKRRKKLCRFILALQV